MSPLAILYIGVTILMSSIWRIIVRTKTKPTTNDLAFSSIIDGSAALITCIIFLFSDHNLTVPTSVYPWIGLGLSIALSTVGDYLILVSSKYADIADTSILLPLSNLWVACIAVLFLGEQVTPMRWIAIICIVIGSMITVAKGKKFLVNRGIIAILIYGVVNAIMVNVDKGVSGNFSIFIYTAVAYASSSLLMAVALGKQRAVILKKEWKTQQWWIVAIGATWSIFSLMILSAYKFSDVSTVIPFVRLFIVIVTAYSLLILKERDRMWQKILGSVIVTGGAILLAYVG